MNEKYNNYLKAISRFIPKNRIYLDDLRRLAWGTDASFYRYVPQMVIRSKNEAEVSQLVRIANSMKLPVTFRAAGTSLCGQTATESIMIVAGKHWEDYEVAPDAMSITLQPGIIGAKVDEILKPYGRIFTPDPASKKAAMVGGIVINNASGMSCGTHANSDRELLSMRIVFADGTVLDTGDEASRNEFAHSHAEFIQQIEDLRDDVISDPDLVKLIKHKYSIKNVTGLNIAPFVRFSDPFDIITHLMVGSEGTLGFASQFTMATGHLYSHSASAMLYFSKLRTACEAIVALKSSPIECAEMLDSKSLASVNDTTGKGLTAVLIRTSADSQQQLDDQIEAINKVLSSFELYVPARFTSDPKETGKYWAIRSGIFPSVGGTRPLGTTVLIEDIAFHINDLPDATDDLERILAKHGYDDSCIYGHAIEGNYHFILSQSFDTEQEVKRYDDLMHDIITMVVDKYGGSLKAEHGTGRNMAPFVEHEWGEKAFGIMKRVKKLFDPNGVLNPGVLFNDDPECHIKHFKPMPLTNVHVNKCIECGFCEVNCVSCGYGLSSRQRIIVQREISRLRKTNEDPERLQRLLDQYKYYGNTACAGDGLCATSCPMHINTGEMTHDLRAEACRKGSMGYSIGDFAARNLPLVRKAVKGSLHMAQAAQCVLGDNGIAKMGRALHSVGFPLLVPAMPHAHNMKPLRQAERKRKVVYFPSCLNQTMGRASHGPKVDLVDEIISFLNKAGWEVVFPHNMGKMCCGMIWESKGMPEIANRKTAELEEALWQASEQGKLPVICDQSPCMHRMKDHFKRIKPLEIMEFVHDYVAPLLDFHPTDEPVAVHLTCSTRLMGLSDKMLELAHRCSRHVLVPDGVGCCAFAGDHGFNHPELNAYALRKLRPQIEKAGIRRGFSNSRTCEIGLTTNSGVPYQSLIYLIDECTTPKKE